MKPDQPQRLRQRRIPKIQSGTGKIDVVETRLALSANPGAELLADAFAALNHDVCAPQAHSHSQAHSQDAFETAEVSPAVIGPDFAPSSLSGGASNLLDQASDLRQQYGLTGAGQTIAVIDSGIAWDHVALGEGYGPGYRVVGGWDFAENDANPYDDAPGGFHGTHVAGIIGGDYGENQGVAPGADLVGLRVFNDIGRSSLDWIESALQWVYDNRNSFENPITTVNLSIGALLPDALASDVQLQLEDELQQLKDGGIVVVAAAGNQFDSAHPDRLNYPASSLNAWAVASSDGSDGLSGFSQRNNAILAAPGEGIVSTVPDYLLGRDGRFDDYYSATGTSMSAPQVAAASMLIREAFQRVGEIASPDAIHNVITSTADLFTDAETGNNFYAVNLSAAIASILGTADGEGPASSETGDGAGISWGTPAELGVVRWGQVDLDFAEGARAVAAQDGLFSIRADDSTGNSSVRVTDASGLELWNGRLPETGQLDIPVEAGQSLTIHAAGDEAGPAISLHLANVFSFADGRLNIDSGSYNPDIVLDLQSGFNASVGEFQYAIGAGQVTSGLVDGGSGADQLEIIGSSATTRLTLNPYADGLLAEGNLQIALRGFEDVTFDGGGGADRAYLYDTRGDDILTARPGYAKLEGVGFRYEISGIDRSFVHATAGGQDVAFLHDSSGNDSLAVRPQFVSLRGNGFFNSVNGFEKVYAYSNAGGSDHADLYDSSRNDTLTASSTSALITSTGYYAQARGFESVTAYANAGGTDSAIIYADGSGNDRWVRTDDQITLKSSDGADRTARGFESVRTIEGGVEVNVASASWIPSALSFGDQPLANPELVDAGDDSALKDDPAWNFESGQQPAAVKELNLLEQLRQRERNLLEDLFATLGEDEN